MRMALDEWGTALYGASGEAIAGAIEHCKMNMEWPPSIAEFVKLCQQPRIEAAHIDATPMLEDLRKFERGCSPQNYAEFQEVRKKLRGY